MTTSIKVACPAHASWRVQVEASEGGKIVETITLDPNSERTVTIWNGRTVTVSEIPLAATKEKTDGVD